MAYIGSSQLSSGTILCPSSYSHSGNADSLPRLLLPAHLVRDDPVPRGAPLLALVLVVGHARPRLLQRAVVVQHLDPQKYDETRLGREQRLWPPKRRREIDQSCPNSLWMFGAVVVQHLDPPKIKKRKGQDRPVSKAEPGPKTE